MNRIPPDSIYKSIGTSIRSRRKTLELTQERVAARIGISRASLANIEIGRQKLLVHQLCAIAAVLEVSPEDLLPQTAQPEADAAWLPLPRGLKTEQKKQIARLFDDGRPRPVPEEDTRHGSQTRTRSARTGPS